jgi:aerotaxis receptor
VGDHQSRQSLTGLVKNRCKNGDHYWVEATAAPLIENGQITGYTSIRVKPERQAVDAASVSTVISANKNPPLLSLKDVRFRTPGPSFAVCLTFPIRPG